MIRVLLVDDHQLIRQGLRLIFQNTSGIEVADEAENGAEVIKKIMKNEFDVVILDISFPQGPSGLEILKQIKSLYPDLPVLMLSMYAEKQYAVRTIRAGASGYVIKDSPPNELIEAIRKVHSGRKYITPKLAELLADEPLDSADKKPHELLSDREYEVLILISQGNTSQEISVDLNLSPKTISTYRTRILEKMMMKTNADLMQYAFHNHLVE